MQKSTKVSEVMTDRVIVADSHNKFSQVCALFLEKRLHHLVVVDKDQQVAGIIGVTDVLRVYRYESEILGQTTDAVLDEKISLSHIMTPNPITLNATDTIGVAAELFTNNHIHAFPVVDADKKVVGIITTNDLIRHFAVVG
ncbi:MAG: CBS domain-containing protein [Chitinophagales bacterium]|jgi:CBS domain-containing protein|nr:CBS domain-containing protein [Chitinophagales bacterium]HNI44391.1 CBS domain-containing protein [Chitinophagales bacterium]